MAKKVPRPWPMPLGYLGGVVLTLQAGKRVGYTSYYDYSNLAVEMHPTLANPVKVEGYYIGATYDLLELQSDLC